MNKHGGKRPGSGPKVKPGKRNMRHRTRAELKCPTAFHVTLRIMFGVCSLRSRRLFFAVANALLRGASRFGVRIIQYTVLGNHIHLLVEAPDSKQLPRAMKGVGVRLARGINRVLGRRGQVIADRYYSRPLYTPLDVSYVTAYIRENYRKHMAQAGKQLPRDFIDPCSSLAGNVRLPLPRIEIVRIAWGQPPG
jgi:REP element-mobilizing transposase RayT